jgi:tetratricopeptide (TPR) repeat protein
MPRTREFEPHHHGVLALDIVAFGRTVRTDLDRVEMRGAMRRGVEAGLDDASIEAAEYDLTDQGDGLLVVFEPQVAMVRVLTRVIPSLYTEVEAHNRAATREARIALRASVHEGGIIRDEGGWAGEELVHAFRLLSSKPLRQRLTGGATGMAVIVSRAIYDGIVRHGFGGVDKSAYRRVSVTVKETRRAPAWVWVPDRPGVARVRTAGRAEPDRAAHARISNLPPRNPNFAGRERQLAQLHDALTDPRRRRPVVALHGLPGVGKTQLAREYAHRHAGDYDIVWWSRADRPATILAGLAELARRLGLPDQGDRHHLVAQLLAELGGRGRWLLVFDNAAKHDVRPYLPGGEHGHIVVTTTDRASGGIAHLLRVDVPPATEASRFLLERVGGGERPRGRGDTGAARRLAEELGRLPLALEQAAAYIEETGLDFDEYRDLYIAHSEDLLNRGEPADYGQTVTATFRLAFERIAERVPESAKLAELCAFLGPTTIPHELIRSRADLLPSPLAEAVAQETSYVATIGALHRASLVERDDEGFRMHQLVQDALRGTLTAAARSAWAQRAALLLDAAWPDDPEDPKVASWCRKLVPHALEVAELADGLAVATAARQATARLLRGAGVYHIVQGDTRTAMAELERALAVTEAVHGPASADVAVVLTHLSRALRHLGQLPESRAVLARAVAVLESVHGPDHPRVAWSLTYLGATLRELGDYDEALVILRRALGLHEAAHGDRSGEVAWTLMQLGRVQRRIGDHAGARETLQRAVDIDEAMHGADDYRVAPALIELGRVLRRLGDYEGARATLERALAIEQGVFGADHPKTAQALTHYGAYLRDAGELPKAQLQLERALAINEAVYGPDHHRTAWTRTHLGRVLRRRHDLRAARAALEHALRVYEEVRGPYHGQVAGTLVHLSTVQQAQGDLHEARGSLERALAITIAASGPTHPDVAWILTHLSAVLLDLHQHDAARTALDRAIAITGAAYGPDHPDVAWTLTHVGTALQRNGRPDDAKPLLEEARRIVEARYDRADPQVATTQAALGMTLRDLGKRTAAEDLLSRAFVAMRNRLGPDHPETRTVDQALAELGE